MADKGVDEDENAWKRRIDNEKMDEMQVNERLMELCQMELCQSTERWMGNQSRIDRREGRLGRRSEPVMERKQQDGDYTTVSPDATCLHVYPASTKTEHCSRKCCLKILEERFLPLEIMRMDSRSRKLYLKALETGEIEVHNIRVMVVGHVGVGKSTLTKRLLGEDVDINARNSTDGIDVHVKRCRVDLRTGIWKVNAKDTLKDDPTARLVHVVQQEVSKIGNAENPIQKASYHQHVPSDGETSLETSSTDHSICLSDAPSGLHSTDSKQNKESIIQTRADGVVNTSSSLQTGEELKLLVHGCFDKEMRDITHYADLSIWDFAGQSDFYSTHQMFLSPRSVYILVIDLSQTIDSLVLDDTCCLDAHGEKKMTISEFVEFWLQSIFFYTNGEENVILVGTHAGELPEEGREEHINKIFENLRFHLLEKPFSTCLSDNDFAIDNRIEDPTLEKLKSAIFRVAESKNDYWGERIPARWLTLERELNEMRQKGEKIIESHVFEKTNEMLSCSLPQEELDLFLRFHHECGLLLFFSEDNLRDFIILDSQWLIDAFKCFITAEMFMKKRQKLALLWKKFKNSCVLTKEFIDASWDHSNDKRFLKHKVHLLRLMEKLDIIVRPVTYPDDDGHQNSSKILEGDYFLPCMLKEKPPPTLLNTTKSKSTSRLCYTYSWTSDPDSGFVPPAVFHRLLAACMLRWPPRTYKTKSLLFSGFGMFDLDSSRTEALTLYLRDDIIQMWITHFGSSDYPNVDTCIKTKDTVESLLQKVCSMQDITTCIKCPETDCSSSEGMIEISSFRDNPEYCCPMHEEPGLKDHIIQSAKVLHHWGIIEAVDNPVSFLDREPKDWECATMAGRIGQEWQQVGHILELPQAAIDHICLDNSATVDRIYSMLNKWRKMHAGIATFRALEEALKTAGSNVDVVFEDIPKN